MDFSAAYYPVDKERLEAALRTLGITKAAAAAAIGYHPSAISKYIVEKRISGKNACKLYNATGITPYDYAVSCEPVRQPEVGVMRFDETGAEIRKPLLNEALLPDGIYTLEIVDVHPSRRTGDMAEGYRFITIASGNDRRQPYYFSQYVRKQGGQKIDSFGEAWVQHLMRVALGAAYSARSRVEDMIGRKLRAYVMIYEKGEKRYNRTAWVEADGAEYYKPPKWSDALNAQTDSETLWAAMKYCADELHIRSDKKRP